VGRNRAGYTRRPVPFLAAAAVIAASYGSGRLLTAGGRLVIEDGLRRRLTIFTVGYVFLATLLFLLGYVGAFRRPVLIAVALGGAAVAVPFLPGEARAFRAAWRGAGWMRRPLAAIGVLLALDVFLASAPPTSGDAIAYHLSAPKEWLEAGRFFPIWWDWNTFQPFTTEFHQALGQALWNGRAAMVVSALLGVLSVCCVYGLTRDLVGRPAAIVASAVWVTQGMFVWESTGGFVELALAGFIALAAWHLASLHRTGRAQDALWAGLAAGAAAGTKYHGLLFIPVFALLAVLLVHRRRALAFGLFAAGACVALPWYVRNWIVTGNPLYPFAAGIFGGKYLDAGSRYDLSASLAGYGLPGIWRLPFFPIEFLLHTDRYERGYSFSPALFLLTPIAVVLGGRTARLIGLGVAVYVVVWWQTMHQVTRYLLPVLPFAALLTGLAAVALWEHGRRARISLAAVGVVTILPFVAIAGLFTWRIGPGAAGTQSTTVFVQKQTGTYDAFRWLDRNLPAQGRVLLGVRDAYWLNRPYAVFDIPLFSYHQTTAESVARMRRYDVRYLAFIDGELPPSLLPLKKHLRLLVKLDVPFVTSRTLGRVEHEELDVWAWCAARDHPCRA
jgi:4-amino-4-deoxy-L-arabinose transferase-like glycosyltransferase